MDISKCAMDEKNVQRGILVAFILGSMEHLMMVMMMFHYSKPRIEREVHRQLSQIRLGLL